MPIRPRRLAPHTFIDQVQERLFAIVRVGRRVEDFHTGIAEYFDNKYPRLFGFGLLDRRDVRGEHWWNDLFQTATGPLRGGVGDGYHLLHAGVVVGFHPGTTRAAGTLHEDERMAAVQRAEVFKYGFKGAPVVGPGALETCRQIVLPFDEIVARKQASTGFGGTASQESSRWVTDDRAPKRAVAPAHPDDPFVLLEVTAEVTDDELKAAYKRAMKLNHPDKVAHMSEAIQAFARERSKAIKKAYDRIKGSRS